MPPRSAAVLTLMQFCRCCLPRGSNASVLGTSAAGSENLRVWCGKTSSIREHYERTALAEGVTAVTGVMDFLRLQRHRRFPLARYGTMKTLPPFGVTWCRKGASGIPVDDVEWSGRQSTELPDRPSAHTKGHQR